MKKKSIISTPKIFQVPDLKEGDPVVIHVLKHKQKFVNLLLKERSNPILSYDFEATINYRVSIFQEDQNTLSFLQEIEQKILFLDSVYSTYSYLFAVTKNKPCLLSVSLGNLSLSYEVVKQIAKKLDVPVLKPNWMGTYTHSTWAAFYEDIFIQAA